MQSIKSYTDLEQSKKLAEILPLESADMCYQVGEDLDGYLTKTIYTPLMHTPYNDDYVPCWSLSALLGVLPRVDIEKEICSDDTYDYRLKAYIGDGYIGDWYDNPIDACVEMIIELSELKLL
jgi:hypothetical protein